MTIVTDKPQAVTQYLSLYQAEKAVSLCTPDTRDKAITRFEALGFPTTKHEEWKYTRLTPLLKHTFLPASGEGITLTADEVLPLLPQEKNSFRLVFINGVFAEKFSDTNALPAGVLVTSLSTAFAQHKHLVNRYYTLAADFNEDAFVALNTACASEGAFVYIPANCTLMHPIMIIYITDARHKSLVTFPRTLVVAEKNSTASIATMHLTTGNTPCFSNAVNEIFSDAHSRVEFYNTEAAHHKSFLINNTYITQQSDSKVTSMTLTPGGGLVRNNLNVHLGGEHAESYMYGLYMPESTQHIDNHTRVDHAVPNCYSNELFKGVMYDKSSAVFNGKIMVRKDAQKTNAFQQNNNILLSDDAVINTKPQLEIFADDVKCSHGATVGQLNEDALFYFRARGIGAEEARTMLVEAFAEEVISKINIASLKDFCRKK